MKSIFLFIILLSISIPLAYAGTETIVFQAQFANGTTNTNYIIHQNNDTTDFPTVGEFDTQTVNSTGHATFFLDQDLFNNFTSRNTRLGLITNVTQHYNATADVSTPGIIQTENTIFLVDCPANGVGIDLRVGLNYTMSLLAYYPGHEITAMSTPTCTAGNSVLWSANYTALNPLPGLGQLCVEAEICEECVRSQSENSESCPATMIAEILNLDSYGQNADAFGVDGGAIGTLYSEPFITSLGFDVANKITDRDDIMFILNLHYTPPGSGGGGPPPEQSSSSSPSVVINLLSVDLTSNLFRPFFNSVIVEEISVDWDSPEEIKIIRATPQESPFTITIEPLTLIGNQDTNPFTNELTNSEGIIPMTIIVPNQCENQLQTDCVEAIVYEIPITLEIEFEGGTTDVIANLIIDLTRDVDFVIISVLALVGLGIFGAIRFSLQKRRRSVQHHLKI